MPMRRRATVESGDGIDPPVLLNRNPGQAVVTLNSSETRRQMLFHQQEADRLRLRLSGSGGGDESAQNNNPLAGPSSGGGRHSNRRKRHVYGEWRWLKGSRIGGGSFGEVYKGIETSSGRLVAGKAIPLPPTTTTTNTKEGGMVDDGGVAGKGKDGGAANFEALSSLKREIQIMKDLRHPNIVRYYRAEVIDKHFYIFMEYVPGGSLRALLDETGPLSIQLASKFTRFITIGLEYLHDRTVVHRDVKAANVLVDVDGTLKLADFGSAQLFSRVQGLCGTVLWMAPEVIRGHEELIGPKSDVWSLGCTLLEMLTAKPPFLDVYENTMQVAAFLAGEEPVPLPPSITDPDAIHFLKMCFTRNPKRRPTISQLRTHPFLAQADHILGSGDLEFGTSSSAQQSVMGGGTGKFSAVRSLLHSNSNSKSGSKAPSITRGGTSNKSDVASSNNRFLAGSTNSEIVVPQEESHVRSILVKRALNNGQPSSINNDDGGEDHSHAAAVAAPLLVSTEGEDSSPPTALVDMIGGEDGGSQHHPREVVEYHPVVEMSRDQVLASVAMDVRNSSGAQVFVLPQTDQKGRHRRQRRRSSSSFVRCQHTGDTYSMPTTDGGVVTDLPEESLSASSSWDRGSSSDGGGMSDGSSSVMSTLSARVRRQQDMVTRVGIPRHIREAVLGEDDADIRNPSGPFAASFWPPSKPCVFSFILVAVLFAVGITLCVVLASASSR